MAPRTFRGAISERYKMMTADTKLRSAPTVFGKELESYPTPKPATTRPATMRPKPVEAVWRAAPTQKMAHPLMMVTRRPK
jgi:hypothetical protein